MKNYLSKPWARPWQDIVSELRVSLDNGLDSAEIEQRRRQFGLNRLREIKRVSGWDILTNQFKNLIVLFLLTAMALSFAFNEHVEGVAILVVIIINTVIGFVTELKGTRSVEALRKMGAVVSRVRRNGNIQEIPAEEIVLGDVVVLEGGDIVTADSRLVRASKLEADESALTGESVPVGKDVVPLEEDIALAERSNMLFKGTALTRGAGEAVVIGTGMNTELGKISSLVEETEDEATPLEDRLNHLGHWLIWLSTAIAAIVAVMGILSGKETFLMIETGIALAVAAIPEGLPIVATIALARGMWRMARRNALIKQLSAVETLGATSVILTDKTGTLTENRMTVTHVFLASGLVELAGGRQGPSSGFQRDGEPVDPTRDKALLEALEVGVLCNNASFGSGDLTAEPDSTGDPLEIALLVAAAKAGIDRQNLIQSMPEVREEAFDSSIKMMATFHKTENQCRVAVKGAPELVLDVCATISTGNGEVELSEKDRRGWLGRNDKMAAEGLRVLALATKSVGTCEARPYENLKLIGLVGLLDPPRKEVKGAIGSCKEAGIRVIMATGDQAVTARTIGLAVGLVEEENASIIHGKDLKDGQQYSEEEKRLLLDAPVFARVSPKQKLDLIALHQNHGAIVAMTGDGVNDAPALKKADIGVAMGQRGTQVAREAADMILTDDSFFSIVVAVEQGRVIFSNIKKFVFYLLSCNISELMTVSLAALANAPLPLLPLQILFLNLVTDVFPALALAAGEANPGIMKQAPRNPQEPIMGRGQWLAVAGYGLIITTSVLGALALALFWLKLEKREAVTVSFLTLAFAQLWHVFNMRDAGSSLIRNDIAQNRFVWGALALSAGLLVGTVYLPGLSFVLKLADPGVTGWTLVLVMSLVPFVVGQAVKTRGHEKTLDS